MAAVSFQPRRAGCYLGESAAPNIINEEIIVAAGAGILLAGTVIGKITASGKFAIHDPAATDGTEDVEEAVILFDTVDATGAADVTAVATVNGPATIHGAYLTYEDAMTDPQKVTVNRALRKRGLKVLPQHADS